MSQSQIRLNSLKEGEIKQDTKKENLTQTLLIPVHGINYKNKNEMKLYEVFVKDCYQRSLHSLNASNIMNIYYFKSKSFTEIQIWSGVFVIFWNFVLLSSFRKKKLSIPKRVFALMSIDACCLYGIYYLEMKSRVYMNEFLIEMGLGENDLQDYYDYIGKFKSKMDKI